MPNSSIDSHFYSFFNLWPGKNILYILVSACYKTTISFLVRMKLFQIIMRLKKQKKLLFVLAGYFCEFKLLKP